MTLTYQTWSEHKDRPVWVRNHREELDALTADGADRVPDSPTAVSAWVDRYDSAVSKRLKPSDDGEEGDDDIE